MFGMKEQAETLSRTLRLSTGPELARRRGVVALSLVAASSMGLISLYQMGVLNHLPDLPFPLFDAEKVDAAPQAYARLDVPDGVLGLGSYAATLTLAAMGGGARARRQPWLPLALAAKVGFDTAQAAQLSREQWTKYHAFCIWCLLASASTFATIPLVIPEAFAALRHLMGQVRGRSSASLAA